MLMGFNVTQGDVRRFLMCNKIGFANFPNTDILCFTRFFKNIFYLNVSFANIDTD